MKHAKKHGSCPVVFAVTVTAAAGAPAAAAAAEAVRTAGYQSYSSVTESSTQDMEPRNLFEVGCEKEEEDTIVGCRARKMNGHGATRPSLDKLWVFDTLSTP